MRPWFMTAMRSERLRASAWSCVTKMVVMPTSCRISRSPEGGGEQQPHFLTIFAVNHSRHAGSVLARASSFMM